MQYSWLNKTNSRTCIVFMSGWGTDPHPFSPIDYGIMDCLMVYDYRHLTALNMSLLEQYNTLHLITWSMGVWVASHVLSENKDLFSTRIAIAGTLDPVHDQKGIPIESYDGILNSFNEKKLLEFYCSMFDDENSVEQFTRLRPQRSLLEIHDELAAFKNHYLEHGTAEDIYTRKIVTTRDRVFPLKNQLRSWGKKSSTTTKLPHFPFYSQSPIQSFLKL